MLVSKVIYLICPVFYLIIKYQWSRDQHNIDSKEEYFLRLKPKFIQKIIYLYLQQNKKFGFFKERDS